MLALVLCLAAVLGTVPGLFLGMPAVGFVLWPVTRAVCRRAGIEIDPHDEADPVMQLEGSLAAGLGMVLGVAATVIAVGLVAASWSSGPPASRVLAVGGAAGGVAGVVFGGLWRFGVRRSSAAPLVVATAFAAGATAAALASW